MTTAVGTRRAGLGHSGFQGNTSAVGTATSLTASSSKESSRVLWRQKALADPQLSSESQSLLISSEIPCLCFLAF